MHEGIKGFLKELAQQVALWGAMEHERGRIDGAFNWTDELGFDLESVHEQAEDQEEAILKHITDLYDTHRSDPGLAEAEAESEPCDPDIKSRNRDRYTELFKELSQQGYERLYGISQVARSEEE